LKFVRQVNISKARPRQEDEIAPFNLTWGIVLQDGRTLDVDVYAALMPDDREMLVHGIHIR
jgi:hypothetical protein